MGAVYEAMDRAGRTVAIKVMLDVEAPAVARQRFEREGRAMMGLSHPNLCAAYDFGALDDGRLFLAMERLRGRDLHAHVEELGALSAADAVRIGCEAAAGLSEAHARGYVHRDITPGNLFLHEAGEGRPPVVKVLDFGIAVQSGSAWYEARVTRTGEVLGTPHHMSPEQARGERTEDARTDVYSLGSVLYWALAGRPPYVADSPLGIIVRMLTEPCEPLGTLRPDLPAHLTDAVMRALAKAAPARFQSMAELSAALGAVGAVSEVVPRDLTRPIHYERRTLADEQRVITVLVANGVDDRATVLGIIRGYGGQATAVGGDQIVGLFGGDVHEGDEASRAVNAAIAAEAHCRVIGVGTDKAQGQGGRFSGPALGVAEQITLALERGIHLDAETARRVSGQFRFGDGRVERVPTTPGRQDALPFVGRDRERADIEGRAIAAFDERIAAGVLVLGPPGIGKSRLLREAVAGVLGRDESVLLLQARGESNRRFSSWHTIASALREYASLPENLAPEVERQRIGVLCEGVGAGGAAFLAAALGAAPDVAPSPEVQSALRDARVMRDQIVLAFGDFFEALCRSRPVLMLVEDVQWADTPSLEVLEILFRRLHDAPFFVLLAGRGQALEDDRKDLLTHAALTHVRLRELGARHAEELTRLALGTLAARLGDHLVKDIAAHTGGNPLFVAEIVGHVALRASVGAEAFDPAAFALPLTVEGAVQSRLDVLPTASKDIVKIASAFGDRFWGRALHALGASDVAASLQRLWREDLVVAVPTKDVRLAGLDEHAFRHGVVREVAYAMLTPDQRRGLHLAAARWFEAAAPGVPEEAAHHLAAAGDVAGASRLWVAAAERAFRDGDLDAALTRLDAALGSPHPPEQELSLRLKKAAAAVRAGRYVVAEPELDAIALLPAEPTAAQQAELLFLRSRVLRMRAAQIGGLRDYEESAALAARAADRYQELCDRPGEAQALGALAITRCYGGLGPSREIAERAVLAAGEDVGGRAVALDAVMTVLIYEGALCDAREVGLRALAAAHAAGILYLVVGIISNLTYIDLQLGDYAAAAAALEEVVQRCRRIGGRTSEAYALHNRGLALLRLGRIDEALAAEDAALGIAIELGNTRLAAYCRQYRALIYAESGRPEQAIACAEECLAFQGAKLPVELEPAVRTIMAMAYLRAGRVAEGLAEVERARALKVGGRMLELEADLLGTHAELVAASGGDATALWSEARDLVMERARLLATTPEALESFLTRVPIHRRIVECSGS